MSRRSPSPLLLVALAVFAVGCASSFRKRTAFHFQVSEDSELFPIASGAAAQWAQATGNEITVSPDGDIPILFVKKLTSKAALPDDEGYSYGGEAARIELVETIPKSHLPTVVLHEMGHILRDTKGHLTENPNAVMYVPTKLGARLTADDIAFICEKLDCLEMNVP